MANSNGSIGELDIKLKVSNISKFEEYSSPEYLIQGIPWQVHISKRDDGINSWLYAELRCAKKNKSKNWSATARATFKLVSFDDREMPMEASIGYYVFDYVDNRLGLDDFIDWNVLIDVKKSWVKDDAINIGIKIEVADPNDENNSAMIFKKTETCCGEDCITSYRMKVTNIESLLAVRSPEILLRKLPWRLTAYKHQTDNLSVRLESKFTHREISCNIKMKLKLISPEYNEKLIEVDVEKSISKSKLLETELASWDDKLLDPENGFVNDDKSIDIEVQLIASKPEGVNQNVRSSGSTTGAKRNKLQCAICSKLFDKQEISSIECGHVFCTTCIKKSIEEHKFCPSCKVPTKLDDLRPIHL